MMVDVSKIHEEPGSNYLGALNAFLISCGNPEGGERDRIIEGFNETMTAAHARFLDARQKSGLLGL